MEGKVCTKCGVWRPIEEYNKDKQKKDGKTSQCKKCRNKPPKETREGMKKCTKCNQWKPIEGYNKFKKGKYGRESQCKECRKEYNKQRYQNNKEREKEYGKQHYQNIKQNNLQYISSIVEQINPVFKQLNLPVYGYVYMFKNVKTNHIYIGQSTLQLKIRYGYEGGIIKSWIKERLEKDTQKFKEELIEGDIEVTETLDVAFCQYHLDKLEAYYIDKYDSFLNGYNNNAGYHDTNDGIEEFNRILLENNLQFINGQLLKMEA